MSPRFHYTPTTPNAGSIGELILRRGQIAGNRARTIADVEAQAAMARGQIWGGTVAGIAGSVGDLISGYAEAGQKADERAKMTRQDTAFAGLFEMYPDGNIPPKELSAIYGPQKGLTIANALTEWQNLRAGKVADLKKTAVSIGAGLKALKSPALQAAFWPQVKQAAVDAQIPGADQFPDDYSPEVADFIIAFGKGELPETPEPFTLNPGDVRFGPDGEEIARVPVTPKEPEPFTLNPGDVRFDAQGQRVAAVPPRPPQGPAPSYSWAKDPKTGEVVRATEEEIRAHGLKQPDTADMRNKEAGKRTAARAVAAVSELGSRIITKVGPAQRIDAIKRGAEAVFGNDPEFRTYQDSRMALAGTLAVEQQGSRVSDADVKALWLPMVPDAYRDTAESYKLKWELIDAMRGVEGKASSEADDAYAAYLKRQGAGSAR